MKRMAPGTELAQGQLCDGPAQELETTTATTGRTAVLWRICTATAAATMAQMTVKGGGE